MLLFTFFLGFLLGALTIVAIEAAGVFLVIARLSRKVRLEEAKAASVSARVSNLDPSSDHSSYYNKQGVVWVLEPEKVPESYLVDKVPREQKWKKEIFEVAPVRKHAKLKNQTLILTESDNSHAKIPLKGCSVAAVSATTLPSRKWAKKYPIKVESKSSVLYRGSKTIFLYFETCSEKESWCKTLRYASCNNKEKLEWFSQLNLEFQSYLTTLKSGCPSFMKPSSGANTEAIEGSVKLDGTSSKVRLFLKKMAKKASKSGVEPKMIWPSTSGREERKISEKCHSLQESVLGSGMIKTASTRKPDFSAEDKMVPSSSDLSHSDSRSHVSVFSDADSDDKIGSDEGTLCWNLLISRLFFDAKSNAKIKNLIQSRIQRTLSNMRTPSYIGEISCTGIELGCLPPYINGMRVLPSNMNEVWALEVDIQYSGGAVLDIETRLEVRELDFETGMLDKNLESSSGGVTSDLLEGFEHFGKDLDLSEGTIDTTEQKEKEALKPDGMKSYKSSGRTSVSVSRWKSILNNIARRVSQVPLSLGIRVAFLKGTLRLYIKPPPSDQLWYGFTSMPDIDFNLESYVGEHKINSGHIAMFLISRFKAAIRETLVLPNCESVCIPWMLAEKDDWVTRNVAPFLWVNQETVSEPTIIQEISCSRPGEQIRPMTEAIRETTCDLGETNHEGKKDECSPQMNRETFDVNRSYSSDPANHSTQDSHFLQELSAPLLSNDEATSESGKERNPRSQSMATGEQIQIMEADDSRPKRVGTRARMLGLGKKMGEKLEEKRRHIEEKGRHIVERMKGPSSGQNNEDRAVWNFQ